jgi:hypothetical protein
MNGKLYKITASIALAAALCAPGAAFGQDDDPKGGGYLVSVCKRGLTKEDRAVAAEYLDDRASDFKAAPAELVTALELSKQWTPVFGPYAQQVPRPLARRLSPPAEGTFRVIFNRTLLVISADYGRVLDSCAASGR